MVSTNIIYYNIYQYLPTIVSPLNGFLTATFLFPNASRELDWGHRRRGNIWSDELWPIHTAARLGDVDVLRRLLQMGAWLRKITGFNG